jgi:hypothetical protein
MSKSMTLPSLRSIVQTGRNFYERCGALPLYEHCHFVVQKAADTGIIESRFITDRRADPDRRRANYVLAQTSMYHVLKSGHLDTSGVQLPAALNDELIAEQIDVFSRLTQLERSGAQLSDYTPLLDNGNAHLALLAKLADYAVTHKMEDHIDGLVSPTASPLFRLYNSESDAQRLMRMDATAGEKLYGPVAELFGYPSVAGDIFEHAYRINHPAVHQRIVELSSDETTIRRMASTQVIAAELSRILRNILSAYGFEAEIEMRKQKHPGKAMKKAVVVLQKQWESLMEKEWKAQGKGVQLDEYLRTKISSFSYDEFHDCVALRVIVHKFKGQDLDNLLGMEGCPVGAEANKAFDIKTVSRLLSSISVEPLRLAVKLVSDSLSSMRLASPSLKNCLPAITYVEKPNGYRAFHFDTVSYSPDLLRVLPFEVQLKTSEWHDLAEHGLAAHYYYLGGDNAFVDLVRRAYHGIIRRSEKP